jgi:ABC-type transporter Mla subunit MlaD
MEWMGKVFASYLGPLLEWIRAEGIGPAIALVIMFIGLLIFCYIAYFSFKDWRLIKKARQVLEQGASESEFANNYNLINQDLLGLPKIKFAWKEFSETLILPAKGDDGVSQPCSNTERPHEFFNLHDLNMGAGFTKSLPSSFIGIGLSLTFLGLISALSSAVDGIEQAAGDTQAIQASISGLLNAASAKFYASLFALFTSIILTIVIKSSTSKLESELKSLNGSIEGGVRHLTLESLTVESNKILCNQLSQLQTFNTDLAMKVGEQVQMSLEKTLSPLVEKMADMGADINDSNIQNLTKITEEVTKGIQGAAGESMERVASTLDAVSDKLGGLTDILSGALASFDSDFTKMLDGLKSSLEDSTHSVADGVGKTMAGMNEGIQESASTVTGLVADLAGTIETLSRSGEEIATRGGEALSASVSAAAEAAGESIARAGQELSNGFKESTSDLVNAFSTITRQLSELENSLTVMPQNLNQINDKLTDSTESIREASVQFRAAGGGLQAVIEPLSTYASETRELMQELTQTLSSSSADVASATNLISQSVDVLKQEVGKQIEELSGSDEHLGKLLGSIESSTEKVLQSVSTYVTEIDKNFAGSVGVLQGAIEALEDTLAAQAARNPDPRNG